MVPQWYEVPVFYFTNPNAVIGHGDPVVPPASRSLGRSARRGATTTVRAASGWWWMRGSREGLSGMK